MIGKHNILYLSIILIIFTKLSVTVRIYRISRSLKPTFEELSYSNGQSQNYHPPLADTSMIEEGIIKTIFNCNGF